MLLGAKRTSAESFLFNCPDKMQPNRLGGYELFALHCPLGSPSTTLEALEHFGFELPALNDFSLLNNVGQRRVRKGEDCFVSSSNCGGAVLIRHSLKGVQSLGPCLMLIRSASRWP
jgi:hypothetical protein